MRGALLILLAVSGCAVRHEVPPGEMTIRTRAYESRKAPQEYRAYESSGKQLRVKSFKSSAFAADQEHKPFVSRAQSRLDKVFAPPEKTNSSNPFLAPWNGVKKEQTHD